MIDTKRVRAVNDASISKSSYQVTEDSRISRRQQYAEGKERVSGRFKVHPQQILYSRGSGTDSPENDLMGECRWCMERDRCKDGTICRQQHIKYLRMCEYIHNHMN